MTQVVQQVGTLAEQIRLITLLIIRAIETKRSEDDNGKDGIERSEMPEVCHVIAYSRAEANIQPLYVHQRTALDLEVKSSAEPNMLIYEIDTTPYLVV